MLLEKSGANARTERIFNAASGCKMTSLITAMHEARAHHGTGDDATFAIAALYKFVDLDDHRALQPVLQDLCDSQGIQGTVLLAEEGINGTICGTVAGMETVLQWLADDSRFNDLSIKFSFAGEQAFLRMKVRLKREIVTMGCPDIRPAQATGTYVDPAEWDALIDDPDVMVIDTRNRYETAIGSFRGAVDPETDSFREFPEWAAALASRNDGTRPRKLAMFCTGGIRCEKASALMQSQGFDEVYHLKGGILKYLEISRRKTAAGRANALSLMAVWQWIMTCSRGNMACAMPAVCRWPRRTCPTRTMRRGSAVTIAVTRRTRSNARGSWNDKNRSGWQQSAARRISAQQRATAVNPVTPKSGET
jgi:predicted sulfurtransferase